LDVEVADSSGAFADFGQELQQFLFIAVEFGSEFAEQDLEAARAGAEAVHTLGLRFRRELDDVAFKLLKNRAATLWSDRYRHGESEEKYRLVCEKAMPKSLAILTSC
jgi:hypothetical protein